MSNLNKELAEVHMYLKHQLDKVLQSNDVYTSDEMKKLAHAVLICGKIAYEYDIKEKHSPKKDKEIFYNTIYDN